MNNGTTHCRQCEREIDDSLTWCPFCGAETRPGDSADPSAAMAAEMDDDPTATAAAEVDPFTPTTRASLPGDTVTTQPSSGSKSRIALVIGAAVLAIIGVAVAVFLLRSDNRGDLSVTSVRPGDCWNDVAGISPDSEIADLPEVPCDEPHANEVFAVVTIDGGGTSVYPGQGAVQVEGFAKCLPEFESFVGVPFSQSFLDIYTLFPTATSWANGDREVICSLYPLDESLMEGTMRGSAERLPTPAMDVSAGDCTGLADRTIEVAQGFIDFYDDATAEELEALVTSTPPGLIPLIKSESMLIANSALLGCSLDDLNILVMNRSGALTFTSEIGGFIVEEITTAGFFATG